MNFQKVNNNGFEKDMASLDKHNYDLITAKLETYTKSLQNGKTAFFKDAEKPYIFNLKHGAESSLYSLKVTPNYRLIASIDEDPLFSDFHFTLYKIVKTEEVEKAYKKVGEELYREECLLADE